ncbi:rhamnogalacturonan acetylesterase [Mangrovibacterium marinum]|uniref:Lysophospholipase L1-like esterase n=1 Tax=Mangrovibacterium marinum TaxID=1639118 RepID=A0A2T5C503_9BACT|nr:rhamnogalacturonan acetylesterase [Mangrovibacterium marinum]PTN09942.1 lysophospholipase L1-like esterase [Mangrovibacterium marinum]
MKTKLILLAAITLLLGACQSSEPRNEQQEEKKVKIYMIGDSTMANKEANRRPETGWGMVFNEFFNAKVTVDNHAVNGRSSKSFIGEGRWKEVYDQLQPGDYLFIQFGHNDQKFKSPDRYTNPFTTYRANLERYVREAREKGAVPILLSSIVRRNFNEYGCLIDTHSDYPLVTRLVADAMDVPFIDLQRLTEFRVTELGPDESKQLYNWLEPGENENYPQGVQDDTHLNDKGAHEIAQMVIDELKKQHILESYIK